MKTKLAVTILSMGTLLAAAPVFAAPPQWAPAHGYRDHQDRVVVVDHYHTRHVERPVYVQPRPVYVQQPVYVQPAPVYQPTGYYPPAYPGGYSNTAGTIGGAAIGAFIGGEMGHGSNRSATAALGAVVGGLVGANITR